MEYNVEEISPVQKKIVVTVAPEEVDAALASATALIGRNVQIDGFRKGKAPAAVLKRRFHQDIEQEARDNLINVHINDITQKINASLVSPVKMTGDDAPLAKGEPFTYTMEFEVAPTFDLPVYEDLEGEEELVEVDSERVEEAVKKMRKAAGRLVPVDGVAPAKDGQIAVMDFEPFVDGKPVPDMKTTGFELELGKGEALDEFEDLIKGIPVGHTGEKEIDFPEDFLNPDLAGKKVTMKVTVHAVKEREPAPLDDAFAQREGYKDVADLYESLAKSLETLLSRLYKSETQKKLLDKLVKQTNFALPPSMVEDETYFLLGDHVERMERIGKAAARTKEDVEKLREEFRPQAEERTREKILLLAIAKKENLEVSHQEVLREVFKASQKMGEDFNEYFQRVRNTGMMFQLRDSLLCDKAMDLVYDRAKITKIPQKSFAGKYGNSQENLAEKPDQEENVQETGKSE